MDAGADAGPDAGEGEEPLAGDAAIAADSQQAPATRVSGSLQLARQEAALRDYLRRLPSLLSERSARENLGRDRAGWRHAERLLRPCAALTAFDRALRRDNPLNRLSRFRLQQLLLWQAQRGLSDLSPLGEQLAARYAQAARGVASLPQADSDEFLDLSRGVARFGADGLRVGTEQLLLPVDNATLRAVVRQTQPLPIVQDSPDAPVGHATLFVRDSRGEVVNAQPRAISLPLDSETMPYELQMMTEPDRNPNLYTVLMFRGREFVEDFLPETIGGFRVAFEPPVYDRAQVTLRGYRSRRASIIFVLDCSYSMRQTIPGEQQDDPRARMEIAKSKLQEMLQQLGRQDDVRVGVYFFGHRRGWSRENPNEAITQDSYAGADLEQLESLHPGEDVEEVLPLGRFGPLIAEQVIDKLETVVGWGQTPLYLALEQAQQAFAADDPDTDKSIVVITDGRNYQFAPPNNPLGPLNTTGVDDVLEAWRQYQAKVHIVSLALQAENVAAVEREFEQLAERTGGNYVAVRNASTLIRELRSLLGPARFRLENLEGQQVGVRPDGTIGPAKLEDPLIIRPTPSEPTDYILQHDQLSRRIEVSPGDALELRVAGNGQYIEAIPFDDNGLAAEAGLVQGRNGPAAPLLVRAHRPIADIEQGAVRFQVSVQRKDLDITSRPAEAWLEITPLSDDQATELEPTYFFYDATFLANQPVPLLAWEASNWPFDQARYARLRFWCKPAPTPVPDEGRIALRDILADPDAYATLRDLGSLAPGIRLRVEARKTPGAFRVDVVELHQDPEPDMGALKIVVATDPNAPLQRVSRQFDREHGIAIHSFFFPASADGVFRRSDEAELLLIPGSLVKNGAWQLPPGEALDVEISSDTDTLRPGPLLSAP
jgi:Mg-chelatase subunit ChlD